jgi:hypothetical protein
MPSTRPRAQNSRYGAGPIDRAMQSETHRTAARRAFSRSHPATQRDVADRRSPMPADGSARVTGLGVAAGLWFPSMMLGNASAAGGQILPDLTRAVRGRSVHSLSALATHKHTAWPPACLSVVGIGKRAESPS